MASVCQVQAETEKARIKSDLPAAADFPEATSSNSAKLATNGCRQSLIFRVVQSPQEEYV